MVDYLLDNLDTKAVTPANLSIIRLHSHQAQVTFGVAIIRLRIRDRNRLDTVDAHRTSSQSIRRPPLTSTVVPVMYAAPGPARNATT